MKSTNKILKLILAILISTSSSVFSQTTNISGLIRESDTNEPLAGVNITVKDLVIGTISNRDGEFNLEVNQVQPPFSVIFSMVGYKKQELIISELNTTGLEIVMEIEKTLIQEIVVSASRVEESILSSPVTIEKVDLLTIRQSAAPEFFDALATVKGVQVSSSSLNFNQVNTRGFATIANVRFVQLVDGMDISAPLLNFPTGNIVGIGELDIESMELVPGAASALYGPNAFNGILIMNSKSPFEYQGLSAQVKGGITRSDAHGSSSPYYNVGIRYAKAFNNKFAFKINFSYLKARDWIGNDYKTDRLQPESEVDLSGNPNFDGLNLFGDETPIPVPIGGTFGTLDLRRTGFKEEAILDNDDAQSIKGDVALHYRISDKLELLYNYRYGGGSSVYQGAEKYALRNFTQQFHKLELKSRNFFIRGYFTETGAGDSWNMSAQGAYANEYYSPTVEKWAPEYAQFYLLAMQGYIPGVPAGNEDAAHNVARAYADRDRPVEGTPEYDQLMNSVRDNFFQGTPPGSSFYDNSRLFHAEFNYNFHKVTFAEIMIGGNFRNYNLYSKGTVFNEAPEGGDDFNRININEYEFYGQIAKSFTDAFRMTGSLRYDKNENFEGQLTPRISATYGFNKMHYIRASFQTGFRNPDTQTQFIYFPSSGGILLGSTKANAERYGVHLGGAWTQESYSAFRESGGTLDPETGEPVGGNASLLETSYIDYIKPEKQVAYEIGYKGLISNVFMLDINAYYSKYKDFIGSEIIANKLPTSHRGETIVPGTLFNPYTNSPNEVNSFGIGLGFNYNVFNNFYINGNYNYATYELATNTDTNFMTDFNTPENKFNIGIGGRKIFSNFGFYVNFRWQDEFKWESAYGIWNVPEFGVLDAQINYKISKIKTIVKLGGTNLAGGDYRTNFGGPFVGQQFYLSLTFDQFLN
jgi:outer membrane receptor protein involved in Fe transport